jgi:hypothetical protein
MFKKMNIVPRDNVHFYGFVVKKSGDLVVLKG